MKRIQPLVLAICLSASLSCLAAYHTNTITTPGGSFAFSVDDSPPVNPAINLVAGVTNVLIIDTAGFHPVVITSSVNTSDWYDGADSQVINSGNINLTTPAEGFPTELYYMCYFHGFYGVINITGPPSPVPPANTILEVHVGNTVVMTSSGTNTTWAFVPEFSSNLVNGAWATIPNYTNTFANGTNTTTFPRLDPICGPTVFLRVRQQEPQ